MPPCSTSEGLTSMRIGRSAHDLCSTAARTDPLSFTRKSCFHALSIIVPDPAQKGKIYGPPISVCQFPWKGKRQVWEDLSFHAFSTGNSAHHGEPQDRRSGSPTNDNSISPAASKRLAAICRGQAAPFVVTASAVLLRLKPLLQTGHAVPAAIVRSNGLGRS